MVEAFHSTMSATLLLGCGCRLRMMMKMKKEKEKKMMKSTTSLIE